MINPDNWDQRERAKKQYEDINKSIKPRTEEYMRYCSLRDLRNHLAHGNSSPQADIHRALANPEFLRDFLSNLIKNLLP